MSLCPFHLAFPVDDLEAARGFYVDVLGCKQGRSASRWIDFDFLGHQITAHLAEHSSPDSAENQADDQPVPIPHFGVVVPMAQWETLAQQLKASGVTFLIAPCVRFKGKPGEQATMFLRDPAGNALEIKAMADEAALFAK